MHKQQPWLKKVDTKFDVPMGNYDGAEKCELVGSLSSFPNGKTSTSTSDFTETTDWPFQTPHREKQTTENMQRFFRRGVVRSCSVMVEEYSTIAERFLTTPRRKNRAIFTQNALESLLLLQPWYDHSLQRHIQLQVYQEPLSDRLVKGIWRWHAKDDIYKTF